MSRNDDLPDHLLTIREVAEIQKTCERTVRRRISAGELAAVREGRLLRVRARDLRLYQLQRLLG